MRKKYYIYCDMDGVLADFNARTDALEMDSDGNMRFEIEKDFFKNLNPIYANVAGLKHLIADGRCKVRIISASPNENADRDKLAWLQKYIPELKRKDIILCRLGEKKANYLQTADGILFDDYGKNCREWIADGHTAFKISNSFSIMDFIRQRM